MSCYGKKGDYECQRAVNRVARENHEGSTRNRKGRKEIKKILRYHTKIGYSLMVIIFLVQMVFPCLIVDVKFVCFKFSNCFCLPF